MPGIKFNPEQRAVAFWRRVNQNGPVPTRAPHLGQCWIWTGGKHRNGYGHLGTNTTTISAHRYSYELVNGPIPKGLTIDHLCFVPLCVRPEHLEAVTMRENNLRGYGFGAVNARKTHCPVGHEYTPENTMIHGGGKRRCRTCHNAHARGYWRKNHPL